jgi:outer membrane lipoprotein-sorting protein
MITLVLLAVTAPIQSQTIGDYVQRKFEDASFTAKVKVGSVSKLQKINDDFAQSYRIKESKVALKEPFMVRVDANIDGDTSASFILNGPKRLFKVPRAKIAVRQDLSGKPGQRQTVLDFGIVTTALFDDFFQAKFIRIDRATEDAVFDLTYVSRLNDTSRHRIWIDPSKKIITKREWYSQRGKQVATFFYSGPVQSGGIWVSTKCVVKNNDNEVAGETVYEDVKANTGLPESLFSVK